MYLLIILSPLLGFLFVACLGRFLGRDGSALVATFSTLASFILSLLAFVHYGFGENLVTLKLFHWFSLGYMDVTWGFLFDGLTLVMLLVVTLVSTLVHVYSISYMETDPHLPRFMSYLSLFTFFMLILVTADNFAVMFVGWEGVGLSSYLLINFWHTRIAANKSAIKAVVVNRVGDLGLILGIAAIFYVFKTLDYTTVFSLASTATLFKLSFLGFDFGALTFISFCLLVGAMAKSAQLGLHTWLPDAMEGPTPVSALIHAATMVTAGVFLLVRCSPILENSSPTFLFFLSVLGGLTALFGATTGLLQNDLKRVVAYSTCSQLGYMIFACGLSAYGVAVFHLANHAFFKALLFLGSGSVIHALADEQDMRRMGGVVRLLPFTYLCMTVASLSLMGFPFLTGFYSKDLILEIAVSGGTFKSYAVYFFGLCAALFTAIYSARLIYLTFFSSPNGHRSSILGAHEPSLLMLFPLVTLFFGTVFAGYLGKDFFVGLGTSFWGNALYVHPLNYNVDFEFLPFYLKLAPVALSLGAFFSTFFLYFYGFKSLLFLKLSRDGLSFYKFLNKRWFFDSIYNIFVASSVLKFGYSVTFKNLDRGFVEHLGPYGLVSFVTNLSSKINFLHTGYIYHYGSFMLVGLAISLTGSLFFFTYLQLANLFSYLFMWLFVLFLLFLFLRKL